ncbi:MAG: hypothetical protein MHM6MM_004148 [Cercozoa sp. M6MM]
MGSTFSCVQEQKPARGLSESEKLRRAHREELWLSNSLKERREILHETRGVLEDFSSGQQQWDSALQLLNQLRDTVRTIERFDEHECESTPHSQLRAQIAESDERIRLSSSTLADLTQELNRLRPYPSLTESSRNELKQMHDSLRSDATKLGECRQAMHKLLVRKRELETAASAVNDQMQAEIERGEQLDTEYRDLAEQEEQMPSRLEQARMQHRIALANLKKSEKQTSRLRRMEDQLRRRGLWRPARSGTRPSSPYSVAPGPSLNLAAWYKTRVIGQWGTWQMFVR